MAADHGEAGAHGEEHGSSATPAKLWDLVWRTMNFVVLFVVLFVLLKKPIGNFFSGRRENIAQTLADFETKKAEAEERFKSLESKLADLSAERDRILAEYAAEGEEEKKKIIAHAEEMAERIQTQAEAAVAQEVKAAKADLVREIADMSAAKAEELIRRNINDKDQERLVEEYIGKVVQN